MPPRAVGRPARRGRGRRLAAWALAGAARASAEQDVGPVARSFERLWDMVVVGQASRGVAQDNVPPLRHACLFGLSNSTAEIARLLLTGLRPEVEALEVHDADARAGATAGAQAALARLRSDFGVRRVQPPGGAGAPTCDMVLFCEAAPRFSIDRVRPRLGEYAVVAFVSDGCAAEEEEKASPACGLLNTMWEKTVLMRRGYCASSVCMSRVPTDRLHDPNVLPLDCPRFTTEAGSNASVSEFGQDWYALWNFLRHAVGVGEGVYVDVGASLPFEYSNTVIFDRCLQWRGICVEPNPYLAAFLQAYRGCEVWQNCVDEDITTDKAFVDRDGEEQFRADCLPLDRILERAKLLHRRIDVLSIDVEHGELRVLSGLSLDDYDIRVIIVEVTRGAQWLEVDTALLPWGYAKVAILGRDAVYVKLGELRGAADWPLLAGRAASLPEGWAEFHQRVVDEELEAEMVRERELFYRGLRRR